MAELKKYVFRPNGTLEREVVELPDGKFMSIIYDETGTEVIEEKEVPKYRAEKLSEKKHRPRYIDGSNLSKENIMSFLKERRK